MDVRMLFVMRTKTGDTVLRLLRFVFLIYASPLACKTSCPFVQIKRLVFPKFVQIRRPQLLIEKSDFIV